MKFSAFVLVVVCCLVALIECQQPKPPITNFRRGHMNRVEYIRAVIMPQHLNKGSSPNDDAGHLIAARLGGTGRETYNIVPQNSNINRGSFRTKVEKPIFDDVKKGNTVIYEVRPRYRLPTDTRPNVLVFSATRANGGVVLRQSFIDNPPSPPKKG